MSDSGVPPSYTQSNQYQNEGNEEITEPNEQLSETSVPPSLTDISMQPELTKMDSSIPSIAMTKLARFKKRMPEEYMISVETSERFASRLTLDHAAVLHPDVDSPFTDHIDIVERLLPYHIFQQPNDDSKLLITGKGKGRALDFIKTEISETRFALDCFKRRQRLWNRFRRAKIRSGKRSAPDDQSLVLTQTILETDRAETVRMNNELRTARGELDRLEREKRAAASSTRITQFSVPNIHTQYYRTYPYAYTQAYGVAVPSSSTSTFSLTPTNTTSASNVTTLPSGPTPYNSTGAIPVQLPVASLPALHQLGIIPVPASSTRTEGQPQPPAVLRGSTSNGSMLSLEINVSLLQPAQMSGLATVLYSLMSRNGVDTPGTSNNSTVPGTTNNPSTN